MRKILTSVCLFISLSIAADPLDKQQIHHVCEYLLAAPNAKIEGPLDPLALRTLLSEFGIKEIGPLSRGPQPPLTHPRVQRFIRDWARLLRQHKDAEVQALGRGLIKWNLNPISRAVVVGEDIPEALAAHARSHVENELDKLPPALLQAATRLGRTMYITFGAITQSPLMSNYKGVVPRGWNLPWDVIPGAGGGREGAVVDVDRLVRGQGHGSYNIVLHEVLHNIDYTCTDISGAALSDHSEFLRLWQETDFHPQDDYQKSYPEETFAEFGAWYFNSPQTREMLRDLYPEWFGYFKNLSVKFCK